MTKELCIEVPNANTSSSSDNVVVLAMSIRDPYVLLMMTDGSIRHIVGGYHFFYLVHGVLTHHED